MRLKIFSNPHAPRIDFMRTFGCRMYGPDDTGYRAAKADWSFAFCERRVSRLIDVDVASASAVKSLRTIVAGTGSDGLHPLLVEITPVARLVESSRCSTHGVWRRRKCPPTRTITCAAGNECATLSDTAWGDMLSWESSHDNQLNRYGLRRNRPCENTRQKTNCTPSREF